jgi:glutamine---fructose-6-phosphate transaminase (isomerizing)
MAAEMAAQPEVLARLAARAPADAEAVRAVVPRPLAGTVFLARGSSDNAAVFGRYLAELCAGRPAGLAAPSLYTRYHADVDWHGYLVVALSQSGATPEVVSTCQAVRGAGATVIGITNEPGSPLAGAVDLLLTTDAGAERAVPATKTVTAQFALLVTVASALSAGGAGTGALSTAALSTAALRSGAPGTGAQDTGAPGTGPAAWPAGATLAGLPGAVAATLDDPGPARELAGRWHAIDRLVVAGRGLGYAAALETALKVAETTGILAGGMSAADLYHGPIAAVYAGAPVLLVNGSGPGEADLTGLQLLLDRRHAETAGMPVPAGLAEPAQVITAIVRGQQLAHALALARGTDPDAPAHLTKVTQTT